MKFRKLYLYGFKSFARPTTLLFEDGITAIVGPNGSGKSNVVDAIRWLLGEKSIKNLRGTNTEDLLFSGNRSTPASNKVEVSMYFDDSNGITVPEMGDYNQVTVTKRFEKDGKNNFLINNRSHREKDLIYFFTNSVGIGKDYSIIEQGQVSNLIDASPRERAKMIEDFAQIGGFLLHKNESLQKLNESLNKLEQLEPLLAEWEQETEKYKEEAELYEKFSKLDKEAKKYQISYMIDHFQTKNKIHEQFEEKSNKLKITIENIQIENDNLDTELSEDRVILNNIKTEYENINSKISNINTKLQSNKSSIDKIKFKTESLKNDIQKNQTLLNELSESVNTNKKEKVILEEKIIDYEKKITVEENKFNDTTIKMDNLKNSMLNKENELNNLKDKLVDLKAELIKSESTIGNNSENIKLINNNLVKKENRISEIKRNRSLNNDKLNEIKLNIKDNEIKKESLSNKYNELLNQQKNKESEIYKIKNEIEEIKSILRNDQIEFDKLKSEIGQFGDLGKIVKAFINFAEKEGIKTEPLVNYLTFVDSNQQILLKFLQPYEKVLVVDNIDENKIKKWDSLKLGQIKIILRDNLLKLTDYINNINNSTTIHELLSDKLDGYTDAGLIKRNFLLEFGTGEGETGRPFIIREKIKNLEATINSNNLKLNTLTKSEEKLSEEITVINNNIKLLIEEINIAEQKLKNFLTDNKNLSFENKRLEEEENAIEFEIAESSERVNKLEKEITNLNSLIKTINSEKDNTEKIITTLTNTVNKFKKEFEDLSNKHHNVNLLLNEYKMSLANIKSNLNKLNSEISNKEIKISTINREIISYNKTLDELFNDKKRFITELSTLTDEINESKEIESELRIKKEEIEKKLEDIQITINKNNKKMQKKERELNNLNENDKGLFSELHNLQIKLIDLAGTGILGDILNNPLYNLSESTEEKEIKFNTLKNQAEELQPVNPMAHTKLEEILKKQDQLIKQKNDIVDAINKYQLAVKETDKIARKKFFETLEKVKKNFSKVIEYLFSGGTGTIEVINEDSLENIGINISVSPANKKVKVQQLSGGEKALLSLGFIFAFFLIRATPFCVLDEVDAPLDVTNTERLNNLLLNFSKEIQFILITHNHKTMEIAHRIYGVSMDKGISQIFSISLNKLLEANNEN